MPRSTRPRNIRFRGALAAGFLLATTAAVAVAADPASPAPSGAGPASPVPSVIPSDAAGPEMTAVALPDGLPGVPLYAVIAGGPGYIAVGGGSTGAGPSQPLILTSADGIAWEAVDLGDVGAPGYLGDVAAFPGGYVAVGAGAGQDGRDAVALVSADGLHWQQAQDKDLKRTSLLGVTAWADGVFAVGCTGNDLCKPTGFTSTDGLAWTRVRVPGEFAPDSVAAADGLLVVVGQAGVAEEGGPVISTTTDLASWTERSMPFAGRLGEADVLGTQIVAAGVQDDFLTGKSGGVVVYSSDAGKRWVQLPDTTPPNSWFEGISTTGPTLVFGTQQNAAGVRRPGAWITRFGADWQRVPTAASAKGKGTIHDFVSLPDGSAGIAVGGGGPEADSPAIWHIDLTGD